MNDQILTPLAISACQAFQKEVWSFYADNKRSFAWRDTPDPYAVVVSEIMLQQTQTDRVAKKFPDFLKQFPNFATLAIAPQSAVIQAWQGLGYNRRALALQKIAERVMNDYEGILPSDPELLVSFPGIGPNTAGSISAFAYNAPTVFIETNIRTVFLHHFFPHQTKVHDRELVPLITQTLDAHNPREWYYALMDYGVYLKKLHKNPSRRSAHHAKQSKFAGSDRELRGALLRYFLAHTTATLEAICADLPHYEPARLARILLELVRDTFLVEENGCYKLK